MIKFIYFDIGGVLISDLVINNEWDKMKREWGLAPDQWNQFETEFNEFENQINLGLETDTFVPIMRNKYKLKLPENYSLFDDFMNRFIPVTQLWPSITELSKKYSLGLFTNMYPGMTGEFINRRMLPDIHWQQIVDSSREKISKPNIGIYQIAQQRSGVKNSEIFFIDNLPENILPAQSLGWQTYLFDTRQPGHSAAELASFISLHAF
jgi:epoxide hydrolase-like predicted phosphatase